jgi:hypothetical protein
VEALTHESAYVNKYYYDIIGLYINFGDTYSPTVLYDTVNGEFLLTSWGDFYEVQSAAYDQERESAAAYDDC